jgi:hypothetical protein
LQTTKKPGGIQEVTRDMDLSPANPPNTRLFCYGEDDCLNNLEPHQFFRALHAYMRQKKYFFESSHKTATLAWACPKAEEE